MGFFNQQKPTQAPSFLLDDEPETNAPTLDRNDVINYMVALNKQDYYQLLQITKIYREAEAKVAEVVAAYDTDGVDEVLSKPRQAAPVDEDAFLDEQIDKVMEDAFIETPPKK